jgi:nucleoside-diphosphate-sugar epimerase
MVLVAEPILGEDERRRCPTSLIRVGSRRPTEFAISKERSRRSAAPRMVRALLTDGKRLTEDTGWRPSVELSEGLARTISWWRGRLAGGLVRRQMKFST